MSGAKRPGRLPLSGVRVVDLSSWIAGAYCTKLLADAGAEVVKIETADGDSLRRWSASGATIAPGDDGALFNFLATSKRSAVVDPGDADQLAALHALLDSADAVVWSRGSALAEHSSVVPGALLDAHPGLIVTAITPFGLDGPWADKPATEFTVQAWSGGIIGLARGRPDQAPVHVGGQIGEWLAGSFAAIGTLASFRRGVATGGRGGELIDVSMLEASALALTYYPVTYQDQLGRPMRKRRFVPTPGVAAASDGLVGLGVGTGQQWLDFCVMADHPEWMEDRRLLLDRSALAPTIDAWVGSHTMAEVLELASSFRIPNAPIVNGANATEIEHFRTRRTFDANPRDGVANPKPAVRLSSTPLRTPEPAPRLGEHGLSWVGEPVRPAVGGVVSARPLEGLRVLDMTAYWAGPSAGHVLAMLGAEVIHLESPSRPDGVRLVGGIPQSEDSYWEKGPIFAALNTNKLGLAIDFSDPRGVDLVRRVVATCDAVIENYTPRVLDQAGLGYESLREVKPNLVMVRMPGFGLDGPWRDNAAFAFVIEDASGLTWMTGAPGTQPIEPYCVGDPNAGLHALYGLLVALAHRDRTGEGSLVEAAMVDAALNVAAEQVIEHGAYGALLERAGNRGPVAAPQNLYQTADLDEDGRDDSWVAIAVATDDQWAGLVSALGDPDWATDPALATKAGRVHAHDVLDEHLSSWCRARSTDEIVEQLWAGGVPAARVMLPHRQPDLDQLAHRRFFEDVEHPVTGAARYSTLPMRLSRGPERVHTRHAPLLGEHTTELLGGLGLSPGEITELMQAGVVGDTLRVAGA